MAARIDEVEGDDRANPLGTTEGLVFELASREADMSDVIFESLTFSTLIVMPDSRVSRSARSTSPAHPATIRAEAVMATWRHAAGPQ